VIVAARQLDVLVICGSLRKGSYNAALARTLPALASAGLSLRGAPSFANFPIYDADIQTTSGFECLGGRHPRRGRADHRLARIQLVDQAAASGVRVLRPATSAVNLKFLSFARRTRVGTSNSKPH
jgi:hypothetical protein